MPIIKSAIKRMKQTVVRRARNVETKKNVKSAVKAFLEKPSYKGLSAAQSEIDTAVKKRVLNKGTAARRLSNLSKVAKAAGVTVEVVKKAKTTAAKPAVKKPSVKAAVAKKPTPKSVAKKSPVKKTTIKK